MCRIQVRRTLLVSCFALVALLLAGSVRPVSACMIFCYVDPFTGEVFCNSNAASGLAAPGETVVRMLSADHAVIDVKTYVTPSMPVTYACSVAFPRVDGIERINQLSLIDLSTGKPLGKYHWSDSTASLSQFEGLVSKDAGMSRAGEMEWQGFFAEVADGSVGGIEHAFRFDVTLRPGTTVDDLVAALRSQGVLANGSANFDGKLNFAHYYLRRLGDGDIHVVFPGAKQPGTTERTRKDQ